MQTTVASKSSSPSRRRRCKHLPAEFAEQMLKLRAWSMLLIEDYLKLVKEKA